MLEDFGELNYDKYNKNLSKRINGFKSGGSSMRENYNYPNKDELNKPTDNVLNYLKNVRGFSQDTIDYCGIKEKNGDIVFPYYNQDNKLVLNKFRSPDNNKKFHKNKGGKPIFWGIDKIDWDEDVLICEGEADRMACIEAGFKNVLSVPMGANNLKCLDFAWDSLEKVDTFIIWADNDSAGEELEDELIRRLGAGRCKIVDVEEKDANAYLYKHSKEETKQVIKNAKPVNIDGLIDLSSVESLDFSKITHVKSSIGKINGYTGGYMMGSVSVWTGRNGSGKSTFLGQELIEAIDQGYNVVAYSGELTPNLFQYWIELQVAGPDNIFKKKGGDTESYKVDNKKIEEIRNWYSNKFWLFDSKKSATTSNLLETFRYATRRHGIRLFLIDNLMTVGFESSSSDYYRQQSEFIRKMVEFAKKFDVHIMIVAHPRKTDGFWVKKEDISGTYNISDQVDLVFSIKRIEDEDREENTGLENVDNAILLDKNRITGQAKKVIKLNFDKPSKRFCYHKNKSKLNKKYGWCK